MFCKSCFDNSLKHVILVFLFTFLGRRTAGEAPDGWCFELPLLFAPVWVEAELPLAEWCVGVVAASMCDLFELGSCKVFGVTPPWLF